MSKGDNQVVFIRGRKTVLRPLRKSTDLESCLRWRNDPDIRQFASFKFPMPDVLEEKWFDKMGKEIKGFPTEIAFAIDAADAEKPRFIGTMGLHRIDWVSRVATTGTIIGEAADRSKGYATDAKLHLLGYAFDELGLRKVCSLVYSSNPRSLRYCEKCGYKVEGRRQAQFFKNSQYVDAILLAAYREDWKSIWDSYRDTGNVR